MSPSLPPPRPLSPWAQAATWLARRVNRRSAIEVALRAAGPWLAVGGALALGARASGVEMAVVATVASAGLLIGALRAALAAAQAPRVAPGDAAWALDRLGRLGERGLASATLPPSVVSDAPAVPTAPRLRPPGGLTLAVAGLLLGTLAFVAPGAAHEPTPIPQAEPVPGDGAGSGDPAIGGPAGASRPDGSEGASPDARPDAVAPAGLPDASDGPEDGLHRLRQALNLPAEGPLDLTELTRALADPALRRLAAEAMAGHPVARVLAEGDNPPAVAAAALLDEQAREAEAVERARRSAAARALRAGTEPVPADRRPLVARYLDRLPH